MQQCTPCARCSPIWPVMHQLQHASAGHHEQWPPHSLYSRPQNLLCLGTSRGRILDSQLHGVCATCWRGLGAGCAYRRVRQSLAPRRAAPGAWAAACLPHGAPVMCMCMCISMQMIRCPNKHAATHAQPNTINDSLLINQALVATACEVPGPSHTHTLDGTKSTQTSMHTYPVIMLHIDV